MCEAIVTAADWNYRVPLFVMLRSLARQLKPVGGAWNVVVYTDEQGYPCYSERFPVSQFQNLRICFKRVEVGLLDGLPVYGHVGVMTYVRLLLEADKICPYERILYIDSDTMVRGDIGPVLKTTSSLESPLAAVRESGTFNVSGEGGVFNWQALELPADQYYFNAGVLGLNLERIRRGSLFSKCLEYLSRNGRNVVSWDQGALNAICGRDVHWWAEKYNYTSAAVSRRIRNAAMRKHGVSIPPPRDAVIAHFTGAGAWKPWHVNTISPFAGEYRRWASEYSGEKFSTTGKLEYRFGVALSGLIRRFVARVKGVDLSL